MLHEKELATYIADMVLELRNLAKGAKMLPLQGLLEISYYEAYAVANQVSVPLGEEEHLHELGEHARRMEKAA
jgi:hypothetical protein